ncbi:NAD(P)-binding protein [Kineococcus sp. R8]|uniref:FAD-dependent monooxygenase n=1 Tax=Kineococcus siccus TaxID=2696567 RepID=UPI0014134580|nr:FAD-dependent monooxygenase [Kineococcus siccus]NAZ82350.1 NAD(P)-binding protein [Kineococcus siccus]
MPAVSSALVIGGGVAGAATAVLLARAGVTVDLAEQRPGPPDVGSGITLQGNALRVLRDLGVWTEVAATGFPFDSLGIRAPDPAGTLLVEMPDVRTGGPDLPGTMGMSRPELARILLARAAEVGARIRFDTTVQAIDADADGVDVVFADSSTGRYDVVVGADGIRSTTRALVGIPFETRPTGMGIWRVHARRPPEIVRTDLVYGGRCYIAGYCPTSEDTLYAYLVEDHQDRSGLDQAGQIAVFRDLASSYHGPWDALRDEITEDTPINYTRFESHFVEGAWNRGRVVVIGDAAHACPPTIAQGAAQALEDAAVLGELLTASEQLDEALWERFRTRRSDRARTIVEASVQLAQWMLDRVPPDETDVPGLMARTFALVSVPA